MLNYIFFDMSLFSNSPQLAQFEQIQQMQNQNTNIFGLFGTNNQPQGNNHSEKLFSSRPARFFELNNQAPSDNSKVSLFGNVHESSS